MSSSESTGPWVIRWRVEMAAKPCRRGIWRLKGGGFFVRARVTDPRTGKEYQLSQVLRGERATMREALETQAHLRRDGVARIDGRTRSRTLWSTYAASLFESKVTERKIKSAASRRRWADTLALLVPAFGMLYVDELRYADLATWRDQVARWIRNGMPSRRKRDAGKNKLVHLSPMTANGWISILKVVCAAMTMVFFGFISGARPSTLRPLRRQGDVTDLKWDERVILLRRSNTLGDEIMDETKTALDQEIPLPALAVRVLREHIAALPEGLMGTSPYLFPSVTGGMRSRSVLDNPFRSVLKALGWSIKLTPKGMRRTFNDLARDAQVHDVVTRAISGHETERMQRHYSTAQREEMREAVGRVISLAVERAKRQSPRRGRRAT